MQFIPRIAAAVLLAATLAAPAAKADAIEFPQATLLLFSGEEQIGSYDLFEYGIGDELQAARIGKEEGEEPENDVSLNFFIQDENIQAIGSLGFKFDPFVQFAFGVANFTNAPLSYLFLFSSPYVAGPYNTLTASLSSSFTDGGQQPNGSVSINPFSMSALVDGFPYLTLTTPCSFSGTPGSSGSCPSGMDATNLLSLTSGTLSAGLSFTISARDLISVNGRVDLLNREVSEPATLALLGAGLLGLAFIRRRIAA